jgi:signal transduction histidine kinase
LERVNHELEGRVAQRSRELERANDKFRAIFVNAHHYICLLDPLGHLLAANRVTLEKADVTTEDALGGRFEDLAWWQASQLGLASMLAALEAAQTGRFSRFEATMGSGTLLLDCSFKPILKDGVVELIVWEAQDITEARSAERERTRRQAERQHAERMEMLGRLAGGVAHDFNNLLTIVLAATAVLRQDELGEDGTDALNDIEEAAASATLVTRQLLGLSRRPGAGAARPIDVHDAVTRMSKLLARVLGERHGLQLELCPGTPHVLIDAGRLEQCVMNLVVNARDAMPQGGVVTVRTRVAPLRGQNLSSGDYLVISVEDHGEGIAPELQAKIFDAFFTTKASGQGTGLGLSTVQEIVSSAQGTVTVTSTAGEGTTFELHFPVCDPARIKADPAIDHETTGHEVVVLVEDVAQLRELVGRELRRLGYDMHLFATAEQAIEGLRGVSFDLLVTDIILPGQDGVQLVARLQTERGAFPVVYTTGYSGDAALDLHDDAKNQVLLYKPYRPLALASTIRNLLTPSDPST